MQYQLTSRYIYSSTLCLSFFHATVRTLLQCSKSACHYAPFMAHTLSALDIHIMSNCSVIKRRRRLTSSEGGFCEMFYGFHPPICKKSPYPQPEQVGLFLIIIPWLSNPYNICGWFSLGAGRIPHYGSSNYS